jgi:transposase
MGGAPWYRLSIRAEATMARSRNGQAIRESQRTAEKLTLLNEFISEAEAQSDLATWRRGRAVIGYIQGKSVAQMTVELDVSLAAVKKWIRWYDVRGVQGLWTRTAPGAAHRLSEQQVAQLKEVIKAGPQAAGFTAGVWNGPMVKHWIEKNFGVSYHSHHIPRLLHRLGFSVQRPRKLLARADAQAQRQWIEVRLPAIKKKLRNAEASSFLRTKPASGSTGPCTRHGHQSASNHACRPSVCARPPMCSEQSQ